MTANKEPEIPARRYFLIGDAARLAGVAPHTMRYWEKSAPFFAAVTRRGRRRYYTRENILLLREMRDLIGDGLSIAAAAAKLKSRSAQSEAMERRIDAAALRRELNDVIRML
jgi:DNA-binding transcriptional MerR regulator